jgi:AraC-like DNA-binding protein
VQKLQRVHVELVRRHFNFLVEKGVPQNVIETALGFSKEELADDDIKIPIQNNIKMLKKGFGLIGPGMAIKMGATSSPEILGVLGQIMKNCKTLKEAAHQFVRFQNLYFGISRFNLKGEGNSSFIVQTLEYPISDDDKRLITEVNLSVCIASIRKLIGSEFVPQEMRFSHKKPEYIDAYKQHFRCPLKFSQKEDAIVIDRRLAEKTIPGSYPYMKNILTEHAQGLLENLSAGKQFQDDVKRITADLLPKGIVDIERISGELNMSRWTLTRKLKKEETTFKDLLTSLRKEYALNYLENTTLSIAEMAFLLGYSEASAFGRAFKSWTGKNPNEYRQGQLQHE